MGGVQMSKQKRMVYTDNPGSAQAVRDNPGELFAVIGPFDGFASDAELMNALERVVKDWNKKQ